MTKAYKIILSNKVEIQIDEDEIEIALQAINFGSIGKMRQGIFNPSFLVAIVADETRIERFREAIELAEKHNKLFPDKHQTLPEGFRPLKNIFQDTKRLE